MKTNVTRTYKGLAGACDALGPCARFLPSLGYTWVFTNDKTKKNEDDDMDPYSLMQMAKKRKRRKILDNRRPGERTAAERREVFGHRKLLIRY